MAPWVSAILSKENLIFKNSFPIVNVVTYYQTRFDVNWKLPALRDFEKQFVKSWTTAANDNNNNKTELQNKNKKFIISIYSI